MFIVDPNGDEGKDKQYDIPSNLISTSEIESIKGLKYLLI